MAEVCLRLLPLLRVLLRLGVLVQGRQNLVARRGLHQRGKAAVLLINLLAHVEVRQCKLTELILHQERGNSWLRLLKLLAHRRELQLLVVFLTLAGGQRDRRRREVTPAVALAFLDDGEADGHRRAIATLLECDQLVLAATDTLRSLRSSRLLHQL